MGITFDGDTLYYDELSVGIGAGLNYDTTIHWDASVGGTVIITADFDYSVQQYIANEGLDIDGVFDISLDENYSKFVDLMEMIPLKFRDSVALQQFINEAGLQVGSWIGLINDLVGMLDKYTVGDDYIQYLADLVGLTFIVDSTTTLADKRRQLIQVIDWYKMKGTYQSIQYIGYLLQLSLNFWDLYTNDYTTFIEEPWFVGNSETENPGGLDPSYYKSPHFGIDIFLNKVYGTNPNTYLFEPKMLTNLMTYVEIVRPVNTVPHYAVTLQGECDETSTTREIAGNIMTSTIGLWEFSKLYFDRASPTGIVIDNSGKFVIDDSGKQVLASIPTYFDDSYFFDYSRDAFLNSITKWVLGTGNKGVSPDSPGFAIAAPALNGNIDTISIYLDRTEYIFKVTGSSQQGISELGLYLIDGTTLEIASTFPDINLSTDVVLKVKVIVYR